MRSISFLAFVGLTIFSWGVYGLVLHEGQLLLGLDGRLSRWRPFIAVGLAYFLIAVLVPLLVLRFQKEKGHWSLWGTIWAFASGVAGALGALGIILAFTFGGAPIFVMPLVFGLAPVVNTLTSMFMSGTARHASLAMYVAIIVVAVGAAGVLVFNPIAQRGHGPQPHAAPDEPPAQQNGPVTVPPTEGANTATENQVSPAPVAEPPTATDRTGTDTIILADEPAPLAETVADRQMRTFLVVASVLLTALCWGAYGPILHKGQSRMGGSRMRPFICVGLAYFVVAVIAPVVISYFVPPEPGGWTVAGTLWALGAGVFGALGALGIIYAFNFGGKPVSVMPLVFGGSPVVNTFSAIAVEGLWGEIPLPFIISLILVIGGSACVLLTAPRSATHATKSN